MIRYVTATWDADTWHKGQRPVIVLHPEHDPSVLLVTFSNRTLAKKK
jgi:hypothetical protein